MKILKTGTKPLIAVSLIIVLCVLFLSGCNNSAEMAEVSAKYTEETARAIIESGWKVAGSIIIGAIMVAVIS
ncbi:hypothetical protein KAR91_21480 [Candidatus Pacearchaeota archaeon]|nr:hypothetical protein [Candidatus Pacearchaeota archaeon]